MWTCLVPDDFFCKVCFHLSISKRAVDFHEQMKHESPPPNGTANAQPTHDFSCLYCCYKSNVFTRFLQFVYHCFYCCFYRCLYHCLTVVCRSILPSFVSLFLRRFVLQFILTLFPSLFIRLHLVLIYVTRDPLSTCVRYSYVMWSSYLGHTDKRVAVYKHPHVTCVLQA